MLLVGYPTAMRTQSRSRPRTIEVNMDILVFLLALALMYLATIFPRGKPPKQEETQVSVSSSRTLNITIPVNQANGKAKITPHGDIKNRSIKTRSTTIG